MTPVPGYGRSRRCRTRAFLIFRSVSASPYPTTPQLVELLKMPTCFGAARRVILDHLERRYHRRFNTVWAFVRFAEAERLGLDFTTPPVRPDPAKLRLPAP